MQKLRPSRTAQFVSYNRALGNLAPAVAGFSDPVAEQLLPSRWKKNVEKARQKLPASPYRFWFRGMAIFNQFRTVVLDRAILSALPVPQLVILGAGFDSRAWRLRGLERTVVFEVDHPDTQRIKHGRVERMQALAQSVRYVSMDFTREQLPPKLIDAGFDVRAKTFWLWEGVTMYLLPEAVAGMFDAVGECSVPESRIALTYMAKKDGKIPRSLFLRLVGEPVLAAFTPEELSAAARKSGWTIQEDTGIKNWKQRFAATYPLSERNVGMQWNERVAVAVR